MFVTVCDCVWCSWHRLRYWFCCGLCCWFVFLLLWIGLGDRVLIVLFSFFFYVIRCFVVVMLRLLSVG